MTDIGGEHKIFYSKQQPNSNGKLVSVFGEDMEELTAVLLYL